MLVVGRAGGPIKKLPSLKKKKRPSRLTVSLIPWQKPINSQTRILGEPEKIVGIDNQVKQLPIFWPPV